MMTIDFWGRSVWRQRSGVISVRDRSTICRPIVVLLAQGVTLAQRTFTLASDAFDWTSDSLDHLVLHQVSAVHTRKLCETLGLDPDKAFLTFPNFGNIGPASLPYTLSKMVDGGLIQSGQRLGLMGIGSGLNCAMGEIVW